MLKQMQASQADINPTPPHTHTTVVTYTDRSTPSTLHTHQPCPPPPPHTHTTVVTYTDRSTPSTLHTHQPCPPPHTHTHYCSHIHRQVYPLHPPQTPTPPPPPPHTHTRSHTHANKYSPIPWTTYSFCITSLQSWIPFSWHNPRTETENESVQLWFFNIFFLYNW